MGIARTEEIHAGSAGLDLLSGIDICDKLLRAQIDAASAVEHALPQISKAAKRLSERMTHNNTLAYAAAGSSAMLGMCDGLELPGTFGLAYDQIKVLAPGGISNSQPLIGGTEDDIDIAYKDFQGANLTSEDNLIVISASGSTPYAVKMLELAKTKGIFTIAVANNDDTPILKMADIAVHLPTPPEIIAGSTRMGAGTSQKIALNLMSTLMAIHLGHVYDGMMVNVIADNEKLKQRATRIVSTITGCDDILANNCLEQTNGHVKSAVLIASGARDNNEAKKLLAKHHYSLRAALSDLK